MTTPALHPDLLIVKLETIRCWKELMAARPERIGSWEASGLDDGALFLSGRIAGPNPGQALHRFTDRHTGYLTCRPQQPGDQVPALDVSVPGREAVVWRTGGVWVELWHPVPATAPTPPVRAVEGSPSPRSVFGARLPFGRHRKAPAAR